MLTTGFAGLCEQVVKAEQAGADPVHADVIADHFVR